MLRNCIGLMVMLTACNPEKDPNAENLPPEGEITSHLDGAFIEEGQVRFLGSVSDRDNNTASLLVSWALNGQDVCSEVSPDDSGVTSCDIDLNEGVHSISMLVIDPEGASDKADIQVEVFFVGIPSVSLISPEDGSVYYSNQEVIFSASVSDPEDEAQDLEISWTSSLDGDLGIDDQATTEGEVFGAGTLSEGTHQIEILVTDSQGNESSDASIVEVLPPNTAPFCGIDAPIDNSIFLQGETIVFEATVSDTETLASELIIEFRSDKDGVLASPVPDSSGHTSFSSNQMSPNLHTLTLRVTDDGELSCTESINLSIEGVPQILIDSPIQADVYNEGDTIDFSATVNDADTLSSDLRVVWSSSVDGLLRDSNADINGNSDFQSAVLSVGAHVLSVMATDPEEHSSTEQIDIRINDLPEAPTLSFSPSPVFTTDDVMVSASGSTDLEGDPISYVYTWYRNGNIDLAYTSDVLPAIATSRGETWRADVGASDGFGEGPSSSIEFVILNSPPQVAAVSISPTQAFETTLLLCQASLPQDDDNDSLSYQYEWVVNGVATPATTDTIDGSLFDKGDTVSCQLTPFDGFDLGNTVSSSPLSIQNSAPTVTSAVISPQNPSADTALVCAYTGYIDDDGDASQSLFEWSVNGSLAGTGPTLDSGYGYGDVVVCTIIPSDGFDDGPTVSSSVLIENTPPVLDSVSITPTVPYEGDTLYCTPGTTTDIDGTTSFTYVYSWEVNGLAVSSVSSSLTSSEYNRDDVIRCFATPNDGVENGLIVASDTVLVSNTVPEIGSVSLTPTSVYATTDLSCSYSGYFDADGDVDHTVIDWQLNGVYVSSGPQLTTGYVYGDEVTCVVTPHDGTQGGISKAASVTILNSPPSISLASVTPTNPQTGDTLSCSYSGFVDVDWHEDQSTFSWYVNGNLAGITNTLVGGFVGGDSISCTVTPDDGINTGIEYTVTVQISNTAPEMADATLSPLVPYEGDSIVCTPGVTTDVDGTSTFTHIYEWTVNGVDIGHNTSVLQPNQYEHGDIVGCVVSPFDGIDYGDPVSAGTVTVANSIPSILSLNITPGNPHADDTLICSYPAFVDGDGDGDQSTIVWEINGVVVGEGDNLTGGFVGGDTVGCSVIPFDGIDYGNAISQSTIIANTAPSIVDVTISPEPPRAGQTLTCNYSGFLDIDNNNDASTIQWQLNGVNTVSGPTFSGNFIEGDLVGCVVTPFDGFIQGTPVGSTVTISNSVPVLSQVLLSPSVAYEGDTLQCLPGATTDADGTTVFNYEYSWEVNGVVRSEIDSTLDSSFFDHNDNVRCIVVPCDQSDCGLAVASTTIIIENTEPVVSNVLISPNPAYAGDVLDCIYVYEDADDDPNESIVEWTLNGQYSYSGQGYSDEFVFGDVIDCTVIPFDGINDGIEESGTLIVSNTLPTIASVELSPAVAREGDLLSCNAIGVDDLDGALPTLSYEWIVAGINIGIATDTLGSQYFDRDQTVECIVTPNDGFDDGIPVTSNSAFVANTVPTLTGIFLNPATAQADTTLICGYTGYADVDGDLDNSLIHWEVNGVESATNLSSLSGVFVGGDLVSCIVTPNDGTADGQSLVASLVVENTAPIITSLILDKVSTQQGTVLECNVDDVSDPDGTAGISYSYSWVVNSNPLTVSTDSLYPTYYSRGDEVWCYATPHDGTESGLEVESNHLIIDNVAPTITSVSITPNSPSVADVMTCSYAGFYDADSDVDQSQVSWEVNGLFVASGTTLSSGYARFDSVTCRVVPFDGTDVGPTMSTSTVVVNDVPSIPDLSITPDPADQSDTLQCVYSSFVDADLDSDQSIYSWASNDVELSTASSISGSFTRGDELSCTVTPYDGTDYGSPVTTSITISNGLPTVDSISLTESELYTNSTVTVIAIGSDPDGDAVTLQYQWLVDGQLVSETSATLDGALYFSKHQTVEARVTANDTFDNGVSVSSTQLTVLNSTPSGLLVSITPTEADVDRDDLMCEVTSFATDADGDSIQYSFTWEIENSLVYNGPYNGAPFTTNYDGDTIPVAETDEGEYWICSVVPSDGEEDGSTATDDVEVVYNYFDVEVIAGDTFSMGSPSTEVGRISTREESHDVTLTRDMRVMRYEVSQGEFQDLMGYDPSVFTGCSDCPVENISWHEAAALANEASVLEGHSICYTCSGSGTSVVCSAPTDIYSCTGYRLPTDAEWEYLTRAGTVSAFSNGGNLLDGTQSSCSSSLILNNGEDLANIGYFCGSSSGSSQPVGGLDENSFNLYDLHGNVQEWTNDWYVGSLGTSPVTDPNGASSGTTKVLRGGAWSLQPTTLRSANRAYMTPSSRQSYVGARLLRTR